MPMFLASEEGGEAQFHLLWHLVHQQMVVQGVPTLTWNYLEESIGGKWAVMSLPRGAGTTKPSWPRKFWKAFLPFRGFGEIWDLCFAQACV